jgi:low affinity Fe/Cu permease
MYFPRWDVLLIVAVTVLVLLAHSFFQRRTVEHFSEDDTDEFITTKMLIDAKKKTLLDLDKNLSKMIQMKMIKDDMVEEQSTSVASDTKSKKKKASKTEDEEGDEPVADDDDEDAGTEEEDDDDNEEAVEGFMDGTSFGYMPF